MEKTSVSTDRQWKKKLQEMSSTQPLHLPNCNYGNGSILWKVNVSYTADLFES